MQSTNPADFPRSPCPLASSLDLLGDKWTLLVVRDLLMGKARFAEFLDSPEKIASNILTERLKRLERAQMIVRERYQERPPRDRYELTAKGRATVPILQALVRWANEHMPGTWVPPARFFEL